MCEYWAHGAETEGLPCLPENTTLDEKNDTTAIPTIDRVANAVQNASPRRRIDGRNRTKADLLLFDVDGHAVAVKDYGRRPFWIRHSVGRFLVRRECAAYRAAAGAPGLVPYLGRLGPASLATIWVDARSLRDRAGEPIDPRVFSDLESIVDGLHRRGVALGDLHHRDVLVSDRGEVHVVDLATAWILGPRPSPMRRRIFLRLQENDHVAVARLRSRILQGKEPDLERAVGIEAAHRHARSRRWKGAWNRLRRRR